MITDISYIPLQSDTNSAVKSNNPTGKVFDAVVLVITLAMANSFAPFSKHAFTIIFYIAVLNYYMPCNLHLPGQ